LIAFSTLEISGPRSPSGIGNRWPEKESQIFSIRSLIVAPSQYMIM